jgi:hypothetical protein
MSNLTGGFLVDHKMVFLTSQIRQKIGKIKKINQKIAQFLNIQM